MMLATALKTAGLIFAVIVLSHWLTAGSDEIVEGPPETPEVSYVQP